MKSRLTHKPLIIAIANVQGNFAAAMTEKEAATPSKNPFD